MNRLCLLFVCVLLSSVAARPPHNVVEMKEGAADVDNIGKPAEEGAKPKSAEGKPENDLLKKLSSKDVEPLSVDKLKPPDHLDAVKLEQDGMINNDYKKEIFLGNHEEIDDDTHEMAESKIKDIFNKVDTDQNGKLSQAELESWISDKTREHFDEAIEENAHVFKHLDPDGDGFVEWKEYYVHFLLAKGYPLEQATKHVVDYDIVELEFEDRESLIRYKFKWTDADIDPTDNKLSAREFLAFRHPEQSDQALNNMLRTIIDALDKNDDGVLTEKEFVTLPLGEVDDEEQAKLDKQWQKERIREFNEQMDINRDGKVTKPELKSKKVVSVKPKNVVTVSYDLLACKRVVTSIQNIDRKKVAYLDPRNPDQAKTDAANLLGMMDDDKDDQISWMEIIDHKEVFIESKIINLKRILHDEF